MARSPDHAPAKSLRRERQANAQCVDCGSPQLETTLYCAKHAAYHAERTKLYRNRKSDT